MTSFLAAVPGAVIFGATVVVLLAGLALLFVKRYVRCPANKILVLSGRVAGEGAERVEAEVLRLQRSDGRGADRGVEDRAGEAGDGPGRPERPEQHEARVPPGMAGCPRHLASAAL